MDSTVDTPLDTSPQFRRKARFVVALAAGAVIALQVLWITRQALLLLFLGIAVGSLFYYASRWLAERIGGPRSAWLVGILLFVIGGVVAALVFGVPPLMEQSQALIREAPTVVSNLEQRFGLPEDLFSIPEALRGLAGQAFGLFSSVAGVLTGIVVVLVVGGFTAASPERYVEGVVRLVDRRNQPFVRETMRQMGRALLGWTRGVGVGVGALTTFALVGLSLIGVPGAVPLAVFAGLLTAIPTFGPLVGWAPAVAIGFATGTTTGLWTLGLAVVAQQIEGDLITPKVQGKMVSVAPAAIIAVQIVLGSLAGFLGVLLAVPFAGVALILIRRLYIGPFVEGEASDPDETHDLPSDEEPAL
ncbi:MAG TPA: AI-2E family transporter [Bacteroidetes bacterium]|nr:AI-2E family transporter [Bacteroidota bacterium]